MSQLVTDAFDIWIPANNLGYTNFNDGVIGLFGWVDTGVENDLANSQCYHLVHGSPEDLGQARRCVPAQVGGTCLCCHLDPRCDAFGMVVVTLTEAAGKY